MTWIGTSGFAYTDWKPLFYPREVPQAKLLPHYGARLNAVEINYTFNRAPTEKLLAGWASRVPESFRFCLKAPRRITHERRMRDVAADLDAFVAVSRTLGERNGPILVQLPPTLKADAALLSDLPAGARIAVEFRHESWNDEKVLDALRAKGAAWVIAEDDDSDAIAHETCREFAYLRLRRNAYDDERLRLWAHQIAAMRDRGVEVFCFLRHDADGANALSAERLRRMLSETAGEAPEEPPPSS